MNQRRQELEKTLPEASKYLCDYLWRECRQASIPLSDSDVLLIGRLVSAYIEREPQGKQTALRMLRATVTPASNLKTYFPDGYLNDESRKLKPADLMHYSGWLYQGRHSLPEKGIEVDEREDAVICDSCGGRFPSDYCTKNVEVLKSSGQSRIETWCNHCRTNSENPRLRDTASTKVCNNCEKVTCEFHTRYLANVVDKSQKKLMLPCPTPAAPNAVPWHLP